nr:tRNA (adenine(22)-N(1))-methyltransferase TrmK [Deinococcus peraridilitoris]
MLDARLEAAFGLIAAPGGAVHADIGSDHARLPIALVRRGDVRACLIVEKTAGPCEVARREVRRAGLTERIEVRLGDGFSPIFPQEVHSASLTGLGARTILGILNRAGSALPAQLVLQPNDTTGQLRAWASSHGYHLTDERLAPGFWTYTVLKLERSSGSDPAYQGLPEDVAQAWGPHLLRRQDPLLLAQLRAQHARLTEVTPHGRAAVRRDLELIERTLRLWA